MITANLERIATRKPVQDALKKVREIDLLTIASSLLSRKGESEVNIDTLVDIYGKWLALRMTYGRLLTPPNSQIDEMWHEHILHTEQYFADCEYLFGTYMHHYPRNDSAVKEEELFQFERMKQLWNQHFHEKIEFSARLISS